MSSPSPTHTVFVVVLLIIGQTLAQERPIFSNWQPVLPAFLQAQVSETLGRLQGEIDGGQRNKGLNLREGESGGARSLLTTLDDYILYSMQLGIGAPQRNVSAIIDTVSELLVVQCGVQAHYEPASSQSYRKIPCSSPLCQTVQSSSTPSTSCLTTASSCAYSIAYGDSRNSAGELSQELISLNRTSQRAAASQVRIRDAPFGCSSPGFLADLNGVGVTGLNRGNLSLANQLGGKFSYCFPSAAWQPRSTGVMFLGDSVVPESSFGYTPLVENPVFPGRSRLYYINLQSISVEGRTLAIPESAFRMDPRTGDGGTVLDSATVFTRLVDEALTPLLAAFQSFRSDLLRARVNPVAGFDMCYSIASGAGLPDIPEVILELSGGVRLELRFEHLFVPVSVSGNNATICLAIVSSQRSGFGRLNVLGNFQQSNYLVEFDNQRFRVGFLRADCSSSSMVEPSSLLTLALVFILKGSLLLL